jgi:hypothetical protein
MTANFTGTQPNINAAISATASFGAFYRLYFPRIAATTTAATVASGGTTIQKLDLRPQIPSVGANVAGFVASNVSMHNEDAGTGMIVGLDYLLGSLDVATSVFTDGVAMPTKTIRGTSIQTAAGLCFAVVRTTLVATTPTVTVTFTDDLGSSGQTCAPVLPTNARANSCFNLQSLFSSGSVGVRDVTGMTISTGSSGIIDIYGILPLHLSFTNSSNYGTGFVSNFQIPYLIEANDYIGFYRLFSTTTCNAVATLSLSPEPI